MIPKYLKILISVFSRIQISGSHFDVRVAIAGRGNLLSQASVLKVQTRLPSSAPPQQMRYEYAVASCQDLSDRSNTACHWVCSKGLPYASSTCQGRTVSRPDTQLPVGNSIVFLPFSFFFRVFNLSSGALALLWVYNCKSTGNSMWGNVGDLWSEKENKNPYIATNLCLSTI